ncbi:hypothetical protein V8C44DRAFT_328087 [Trichoderma aethiopicum]
MMIAESKARKARGSAGKTAQQKGQREQEGKGRGGVSAAKGTILADLVFYLQYQQPPDLQQVGLFLLVLKGGRESPCRELTLCSQWRRAKPFRQRVLKISLGGNSMTLICRCVGTDCPYQRRSFLRTSCRNAGLLVTQPRRTMSVCEWT